MLIAGYTEPEQLPRQLLNQCRSYSGTGREGYVSLDLPITHLQRGWSTRGRQSSTWDHRTDTASLNIRFARFDLAFLGEE